MLYQSLVWTHIIGACIAVVTGFMALGLQHRTPLHRKVGVVYLFSWVALFASGAMIGLVNWRLSPFQFFNWLGMFFVVRAYWAVLKRKQLGRVWLKQHYSAMLSSVAAVTVATANQIFMRAGIEYPMWVFFLMCASPALILPWYQRSLDRRYGLAKVKPVAHEAGEAVLATE